MKTFLDERLADSDAKAVWKDNFQYRDDVPPGAIWFKEYADGAVVMNYMCPCGCENVGFFRVKVTPEPGDWWNWDGNKERPTLSPSVQKCTPCRWHGYLRNGEWLRC